MRWRGSIVGTLALAACGAFGKTQSGAPESDGGTNACPAETSLSSDCASGLLRCNAGGACELDGLHDPNHCGECTRACDDACDGGTCAPRHLDNHSESSAVNADTRAVAADDLSATWVVNGEAFRVPDDGGGLGGQGTGITGDPGEIEDLVVDGADAYFLTRGEIDSAPYAGGQGGVLADGLAATIGGRLAFDETHVYFTSGAVDGVVGFSDKAIKPAGPERPPTILATGVHHPTDLFTIDSGVVFLANADPGATNGAIWVSLVTEKGSPRLKIHDLPRVGTMVAIDRKEAFYSLVDAGEIWRFDTTSFTPVRIASGLAAPEHLALDDSYLYVTARGGIYRMKRCGPPATLITADTHGAPSGLVVHGKFVYWSASGGLWRVAR